MTADKSGQKDDDTALSAWERGEGDTPDIPPHPKRARLKAAFAAHPDVCALTAALDAAMNDADDPVPVTVAAQPGLLRLLTHIESLDGGAPVERALGRILSNHLEHLLHGLVTDPTGHPHYARLWNALCAAEGAPELAVPEEPAHGAPREEGPF